MMSLADTIMDPRRPNGSKRLATSAKIERFDTMACNVAGLYEK